MGVDQKHMGPATCPKCRTPAAFLYCRGTEAYCERCFGAVDATYVSSYPFTIVFMPTHLADGGWTTDNRLTFRELREFIEDCLSSRPSFYGSELLTAKKNSITALIEALAALIQITPDKVACRMTFVEKREIQNRAVSRLWRALENWGHGFLLEQQQDYYKVQWRILESHGKLFPEVGREYRRSNATPHRREDDERLEYILGLATPDEKYVGLDSLGGYRALIYERAKTCVLESIEVGTATYIIAADQWKSLSRLSKSELLLWHSDEIKSYNHTARWRRGILLAFRLRGIMNGNV